MILRSAVKHSLGQFNVAPVLDFERDANLDTPYEYKNRETDFPTIQVDSVLIHLRLKTEFETVVFFWKL